ncbi:hypothetical protein LOTGIDRAFT_151936 [Lottia gigantea]|uniref:CCHC-type domain-containing protein n=1 Tax=Lottia gigantea TaxID=225164 RepID=V4CRJ4_LOTGI|nr:hypothetical protein LOTGIDRAFT_151936 [Lottia gigantea]ESP05135.1 hypothetical protein LOTGIDRAFT_151936 [Lottia gigantea]
MTKEMDTKQNFKNRTINVDLYSDTKIIDVIKEVEEIVGEHSVIYACPIQGNLELTFDSIDRLKHLNETPIIVNKQELKYTPVGFKYMIVSFMHIPCYISDHELLAKLKGWNVRPLGEVRRRHMKYGDREIPDGTRYVKCEFPPNVSSLPYATLLDGKSFIIKHNNQSKVCFGCLNPDHEVKNCPESLCKRCEQKGHIRKFCEESLCVNCGEYNYLCKCATNDLDAELNLTREPNPNQIKETLSQNTESNTYDDDDTITSHPTSSETTIDRSKPQKRTQIEIITPPKNENKKGKTYNQEDASASDDETMNYDTNSSPVPNVNDESHPDTCDTDTSRPEKPTLKNIPSKYSLPPKPNTSSSTLKEKFASSIKTLENIDNIVTKREMFRKELTDPRSVLNTRNRFKVDPVKPNLNAVRKSKSGESLV